MDRRVAPGLNDPETKTIQAKGLDRHVSEAEGLGVAEAEGLGVYKTLK